MRFRRHPWEGNVMRPRLRIYNGEDTTAVAEPQVTMRFGEIVRVLADAISWDRTWLLDFADDEVQVPADLHEVITAYTHLRPSA